MERPIIAEKFPAAVILEPGTYMWCACGKSKNKPFCDSTHRSLLNEETQNIYASFY